MTAETLPAPIPTRGSGAIISEAGEYVMPARRYHADPVAEPSLSASLAILMTQRSPRHAWEAHPRLNPNMEVRPATEAQMEGEALHSLILEGEDRITVLPFSDKRTDKARMAFSAALMEGRIPLLRDRARELREAAQAIRANLAAHPEDHTAFTGGRAERVLVWPEETEFGTVWCRSRVDCISDHIDDLKTVDGTHGAHPEEWHRVALREGRFLQEAFYRRGCEVLGIRNLGFRFVLAERTRPWQVATVSAGPELLDYAEKNRQAAVWLFGRGIHTGQWPGYEPRRWYGDLPKYMNETHLARMHTLKRLRAIDERTQRIGGAPGREVAHRRQPFA